METTTSFDLSICRLLQAYPLYRYRVRSGEGWRLPVLIIGSGKNCDALRDKVLSNGQLLDTRLEVTVATENRKGALQALQEKAPELKRFVEVQGEAEAVEMACGALDFAQHSSIRRNLPRILEQYPDHKYVIISLDTEADPPKTIVPATGQVIAWVKGDLIRICGSDKAEFGPARDDAAMKEILDIAFRLHYAYEKGNDPYITNGEIRERFEELYNYSANIECALHVRSKIFSAGIDPALLNSAAEEFARKMAEDARNNGTLLERLARLEHCRWCVSKALSGRRGGAQTVDVIYGGDGSATHSIGSPEKWHVALMPYGRDGKLCRSLTDQDWTAADPEAIGDLDELDKQTLRVHRRCAAISREKLRSALEKLAELEQAFPGVHVREMKAAVEQMRRGSREAVYTYRHHRRRLEAGLSKTQRKAAGELLEKLNRDLGAPMEYLTRKDYKKQNLMLVGSIPFALCGWKSTVLVKLMAETVPECVAAAWQLEPGQILFVDTAETLEELKQIRWKAGQIDRFLSRNCNRVRASYHIFVPEDVRCVPNVSGDADAPPFLLQDLKTNDPGFFGSDDWHLYHRPVLEPEELRQRFVDLMYEYGVTSIDMTGGKPVLISLADGYARNSRTGAFFIRDNRIRNFCGARGMEWQALDKGLGVRQVFDQTEASLIKRDDDRISDTFLACCEDLWQIAHDHAENWYRFFLCYSKAYGEKTGGIHPRDHLRVPAGNLLDHLGDPFRVGKETKTFKKELKAILDALVKAELLTYHAEGKFYEASCEEVVACLRNSGKILEYYIYCTVHKADWCTDAAMSWMFRHSDQGDAAKNELDVICTSRNHNTFFISAKNVTKESLSRNNFLNYVCYEVGWLADRFGGASPITILAAPNVPQFEGRQRSNLVQRAMSRGVYLLGDRCFRPGCLERVLRRIDAGQADWCEFLLDPAAV